MFICQKKSSDHKTHAAGETWSFIGHTRWMDPTVLTLVSRQSQAGCSDYGVAARSSLEAFAGITQAVAFCRGAAETVMRMGNDASTIQSLLSAVFKMLL